MTENKSLGETKKSPEEISLEKFYHHKKNLLNQSLQRFSAITSLSIKIGIELEFYLLNSDYSQIFSTEIVNDFIDDLQQKIPKASLIYKIEKEQGQSQIEIKTTFDSDLKKICNEIENIKSTAKELAKKQNLQACFAAQRFIDDCGSALQFNISLHDDSDQNLFTSNKNLLNKTASILLDKSPEILIFLAPNQEDYARFSATTNQNLFKKGKYSAPINLSFGADNRTCAIRIPSKSSRLEYRIAAANADPFLCLSAILVALTFEAPNQFKLYEQIYGNAFDSQYQLEMIPKSLEESKQIFFSSETFLVLSSFEK